MRLPFVKKVHDCTEALKIKRSERGIYTWVQAWSGKIAVPGVQTFDIAADYVGGTADISELMGETEVRFSTNQLPH